MIPPSAKGKSMSGQSRERGQDNECRFFDLPWELRCKVYSYVFSGPPRIVRPVRQARKPTDKELASPKFGRHRRTSVMLASRRFHDDVSQYLYSSYTFRIFPVQHQPSIVPNVCDLAPRYKSAVRVLRLVLGSSWTEPPESWVVNEKLGLKSMEGVHTLEILVLCDPSNPMFEPFRISKDFYTKFSCRLLHGILKDLPSLRYVVIDGYSSIERNGGLVSGLVQEIQTTKKKIRWAGPFKSSNSSTAIC
ncbi:hypothetical protein MGYG_02741 [Nannizzia gypsea CBS 118893]|uniref:F-box domain-containing protein n=1 Tax=Arthroderma gypseum (strain ATCC MYA-4604 / CBS 118893) TaxID=535722 RepID=E4UNX4_ARTGP|nr:hypothetical protein MGYG_02741 [Nannizzia gypsea CBS 118893]EFQ99727.1 hypothetical protein MGYG_02741 [Nannizzia gypsea CBS 118893]